MGVWMNSKGFAFFHASTVPWSSFSFDLSPADARFLRKVIFEYFDYLLQQWYDFMIEYIVSTVIRHHVIEKLELMPTTCG